MFIVGLVGFAVASAVGGAAPNIGTLIAARAVQGGFAAVLAPAALSLIFPHLRRRQPSLQPVLDRLDTEHHVIGEVLEDIDAALIHLAQNPTELGPISEAVDLLTDTMLSHFAYEERELIAPLAQHGFYPGQVP